MSIEGLPGDAEFGAEFADFGPWLAHGCHGEPEFRGGHLVGAPAVSAAGPGGAAREKIRFGTKWLDIEARVLQDDEGVDHPLTTSEFNLLKAFVDHPRRVLSRERLLDLANARDPDAFDRAIDVRITRIRRKVEPDPNHPRIIRTIRGAGYVFSPDGQDQ